MKGKNILSENDTNTVVFNNNVYKKYLIIDYFLKNYQGVSIDNVMDKFNLTDSGLRSAIERIRTNPKYKIKIENKIITIKVKNRNPIENDILENITKANNDKKYFKHNFQKKNKSNKNKNINVTPRILIILKKYPEGINTENLLIEASVDRQTLYNSCYALRKKGYNIEQKNGIYKLLNDTPQPEIKSKSKKGNYNYKYKNGEIEKISTVKNQLIPEDYKKAFLNLPDNDKIECINLMKKSAYFYKSALALMESNQFAYDLINQIKRDDYD